MIVLQKLDKEVMSVEDFPDLFFKSADYYLMWEVFMRKEGVKLLPSIGTIDSMM